MVHTRTPDITASSMLYTTRAMRCTDDRLSGEAEFAQKLMYDSSWPVQ